MILYLQKRDFCEICNQLKFDVGSKVVIQCGFIFTGVVNLDWSSCVLAMWHI